MIWVYFLPVILEDGVETVAGIEFIRNAILDCTEQPYVRKLVMDTTVDEHTILVAVALEVRNPTQEELDLYNSLEFPLPDPGFTPLNPAMGVEHRLDHVERWLTHPFPPPPTL